MHPCVLFLRNTADLVFFRCATLKSSAALASLQRHAMAAHFGHAVWEKPVKEYNSLPVFSVDHVHFEKEVQQLWVLFFISSCDCFGELEFDQIG